MKKLGVLFSVVVLLSVLSFAQAVFAQEFPDTVGQIAYIGSDFNVYTIRPQDGSEPTALSDNAALTQTEAQIYEWPMWSADGQLAYFHSTLTSGGEIDIEVLISADGQATGEVAYTGEQEYFTYASWSPQACGEGCNDLSVLLNNASGLLVKLIRWQDGAGTSTVAGTGAPFYTSWSPDGTQMIWQRNNTQFEIFDVADGSVSETLEHAPGRMFTPEWSPVDDRLLLGVMSETNTDLVVIDGDEVTTLASEVLNPVWFAWSPDGSSVAYINREGPVIVLDAATGEEIARSPIEGALAFFWSPDSQHIAYVSLGTPPGSFSASAPLGDKSLNMKRQQEEPGGLVWSILDTADGANRRYASFLPTNQQVYMIQYFDQFASSHHIWSPDSRYLVYSEITPDSRAVINLLDTTQDASSPVELAEGIIGIWSFE